MLLKAEKPESPDRKWRPNIWRITLMDMVLHRLQIAVIFNGFISLKPALKKLQLRLPDLNLNLSRTIIFSEPWYQMVKDSSIRFSFWDTVSMTLCTAITATPEM